MLKTHSKVFLILLLITSLVACDLLDSSLGGGSEPLPPRDNPEDPGNTEAEIADLSFLGLDVGNTFEVNGSSFLVKWEMLSNGVSTGLNFSYRIAWPGEDITSINYEDIGSIQEFEIPGLSESLSEDDKYNFEILIESTENTSIEPVTVSGSFLVNKIQSQGFVLLRNQNSESDGNAVIELYVDEVSESNAIIAYRLDLIFDSGLLADQEDITIYDDERNFFYRSGASIFNFTQVIGDTIRIESGIAGNNLEAVSGYGQIGVLNLGIADGISEGIISVSPTSYFKNEDGTDMTPEYIDTAIISSGGL